MSNCQNNRIDLLLPSGSLWTPTFNNYTGNTLTASGYYQRIGKSLALYASIYGTGTGSSGGSFQINLPIASITVAAGSYPGVTLFRETVDKTSYSAVLLAGGWNYLKFADSSSPTSAIAGSAFGDAVNQYSRISISVLLPITEWQ